MGGDAPPSSTRAGMCERRPSSSDVEPAQRQPASRSVITHEVRSRFDRPTVVVQRRDRSPPGEPVPADPPQPPLQPDVPGRPPDPVDAAVPISRWSRPG